MRQYSLGVEINRDLGQGSSFIMNGGSISDNGYNEGSGTSGVTIRQGNFTMNDGVISGNMAGGVSVDDNGTFTMKKGRIINNQIENGYGIGGGGVEVLWGGTFIMDGGEISGNKATDGGGVSVVESTFIMNGGIIANNEAEEIGGGVFLYHESTFTMNGGIIAGNTSERIGGGGVGLYTSATFTKTGKSIIYGD